MSRIRDRLQQGGDGLTILVALALVFAACGGDADPAAETSSVVTTAPPVATTAAPVATTMPATQPTPVPTAVSTTKARRSLTYAVTSHGAGAIAPLEGGRGMLGSGCTPASDTLADGIWFGYVVTAAASELSLDLTCLHPGTPPMVTNDLARLRDVPVDTDTVVFPTPTAGVPYEMWEPEAMPVWIYINNGTATEIAYPTSDYMIDMGWTEATFDLPVTGGCCGTMYEGDVSPTTSWPRTGMPVDGVYPVDVVEDSSTGDLVVTFHRFVRCADSPTECVPDYTEGDMFVDRSDEWVRRIAPEAGLTVRLFGLPEAEGPSRIEGLGSDLAGLEAQIAIDWEEQFQSRLDAGQDIDAVYEEILRLADEDPGFPFGRIPMTILVYRGPLGTLLYDVERQQSLLPFARQLEIVDGRPILYIHAGQLGG